MAGDLRFTKDGVPIYDGASEMYVSYRRAALNYCETLEWKKRPLAGPRLQAALEGPARVAVQHKEPGWISHAGGAEQLLDFLKTKVTPPTLAEAGKMISKFFYQVRRRKGESMNAWILRHDESLFEARRTLAKAIEEYGMGNSSGTSSVGLTSRKIHESQRYSAPEQGPFRDDGRLEEEEEDDHWQRQSQASSWENWGQWHSWDEGEWRSWKGSWNAYNVSSESSQEADKFLPDFVTAWLLLQRSGLDVSERGAIVANLKNKFTSDQVKRALKLNWPEDELKQRDQGRGSAMVMDLDEDEAMVHDEEASEPPSWMGETERAEYGMVTQQVEEAYQAYQGARRTLREAREKQTMMRKNRQFYPIKRETSTRFQSEGSFKKCFNCGGPHLARDCPNKDSGPSGAGHGKSAQLVFNVSDEMVKQYEPMATTALGEPSEEAMSQEAALMLSSLTESGKAIIDGGATSSVGSLDAMEQLGNLNLARYQEDGIEIHTEEKPSFRFGNNGRTQCLSTATLKVPLGGKTGLMKVAVHNIPGQPVLLSIASLRSLGAVIDFERDEMIMRHVDPHSVVQLERAPNGHQIFPLTEDLWVDGFRRAKAFHSLKDAE